MELHTQAAKSLLGLLPYLHEKFLTPMEKTAHGRLPKLQFFALMLLYRKGPMTMSQISHAMQVSKQQLTPLMDRIQEQGLIARQTDSQDRRIIRIEITAAGKQVIEDKMRLHLAGLSDRLQVLSEEELQALEASVIKVRELLEKAESLNPDEKG